MRILIYSLNYWPELTGAGKYTGEMAEALVGKGHEVQVISAPPYYPSWEVSQGYSSWKYKVEMHAGVKITRCPLWVPNKQTGIKRIMHLLSFAASSGWVALSKIFWRPRIIILLEPSLVCSPATLLAAALCRSRTWLHIQDYEVDAAFELGLIKNEYLRKVIIWLERALMKGFSRVSTISSKMIERLDAKGVSLRRRFLFPNWADIAGIYPLERESSVRKGLNLNDGQLVLLYSGNMGEKQGLELLIEAASRLKDNHTIVFLMCGEGSALQRLRKMSEGLNNVKWMPLQPLECLNDLLNAADIHLLPQRKEAADLVMPSKLTGMLASARPIIATANPETQVWRVVTDKGLVVPPGDLDALVKAVLELAGSREMRREFGRAGRQFAEENLGRVNILNSFEKALVELIDAKGIKDRKGGPDGG